MTNVQSIQRRDRWADWTVALVVAIALILGLVLRGIALSRTTPFDFADAGISGSHPAGWVRETGSDPLLRVRNPRGRDFNTTLELRTRPLATDTDPLVAMNTLAIQRARESDVQAYRALDTEEVILDSGEVATRRTFAYVHENTNPYIDQLPVVVKGVDLVLRDPDGRILIATLIASEDEFDTNLRYLHALVESLEF